MSDEFRRAAARESVAAFGSRKDGMVRAWGSEAVGDCQLKQEMIERQEAHRKDEVAKDPYRACYRIEPILHIEAANAKKKPPEEQPDSIRAALCYV